MTLEVFDDVEAGTDTVDQKGTNGSKTTVNVTSYRAESTGHQKIFIGTTTQEGGETQNQSCQCPQGLVIMVEQRQTRITPTNRQKRGRRREGDQSAGKNGDTASVWFASCLIKTRGGSGEEGKKKIR